jgi:WD40 repeat protein
MQEGTPILTFKGHNGPVTSIAVQYRNGAPAFLLTGSWDKTVKKWDIHSGDLIYTATGHDDFVKSVAIFGDKFYTGSSDSRIGIWDLETGKLLEMVKGHRRSVEHVLVSPEGAHLYSCSSDGTVRKWDRNTMEELGQFLGHQTSVYKMIALWEDDALWSGRLD